MKLSVKELAFVDNHVLVVNKPAGLPTQSRPSGGDSLEESAKKWIKNKYKKTGRVFLIPIHRLDLPVSGLVLCARTSKSLSRLQAQMRKSQIEKTYYACVEGKLKKKRGKLHHFLTHGNYRAHIVAQDQGKEAILFYRVLREQKKLSFLEIKLFTGRYHQIRAQFAYLGHPICGDVKYGAVSIREKGCIDLHHGKLAFYHPITSKKVILKSFPPFF